MNDVLNIKTVRHCFVRSTIWLGLIAVTLPAAAAAGQPSALDSRAPSAIELALAEYVCGPKTAASDAGYLDCLSARVAALRADFGYDLTRLSALRRKAIDKSCGRRLTAEGHDAYVACVNSELASMQEKRAPDSTTTPDAGAAGGDPVATSAAVSPRSASSTWAAWLLGFLAVAGVAAGIPLAMRIKTAQHRCRNCGTNVPPTADLCPACRKQAAEAIRHAAAERIERERAFEEGGRRLDALTQQPSLPDEVPAPVQIERQEPVQQPRDEDAARVQEEQPPQDVVAPQPEGDSAATGDELFDPYAVLGVSPDAGPEGIDAAYQQARSKYDPAAVDFLGEELQQYYKSKADAVDRAYRMLAGDVASSPPAAS